MLKIVVKFVISWKFLKSVVSSPGFLSSGVTCPFFMDCGNVAVRKELLATMVIVTASSSVNAFMLAGYLMAIFLPEPTRLASLPQQWWQLKMCRVYRRLMLVCRSANEKQINAKQITATHQRLSRRFSSICYLCHRIELIRILCSIAMTNFREHILGYVWWQQ